MSPSAPPSHFSVEIALLEELEHLLPDESKSAEEDSGVIRTHAAVVDALSDDAPLSALCLSGGGIRSATFCLGAIQGLARVGLLDRFHYLSMVSGGGYAGGWLSAWIQRDGLAKVLRLLGNKEDPGAVGTTAGAESVNRLRAYTNYLSPVWGLSVDAMVLVSTFLRNLVLHWIMLVPLLVAALMAPRLLLSVQSSPGTLPWLAAIVVLAYLLVAFSVAYVASDLPGNFTKESEDQEQLRPLDHYAKRCMPALFTAAFLLSCAGAWLERDELRVEACRWLNGMFLGQFKVFGADPPEFISEWSWSLAAVLAALGGVLHLAAACAGALCRPRRGLQRRRYTYPLRFITAAFFTGALGGGLVYGFFHVICTLAPLKHTSDVGLLKPGWLVLYALVSVPALLSVFWICVTVYVGFLKPWTSEEDREYWARGSAMSLYWSLGWIVLTLLVVVLPLWILQLPWPGSLSLPGDDIMGIVLGGATMLVGAVTGILGYTSKEGPALSGRAKGLARRLGLGLLDVAALLFIVFLATVGSLTASSLLNVTPPRFSDEAKSVQIARDESLACHAEWIRHRASQDSAAGTPQTPPPSSNCKPPVRQSSAADAALWSVAALRYVLVIEQTRPMDIGIAIVLLVAVGAWAVAAFGVNVFSLHGMYGNRLVRAYLGATRSSRRPHWFTGFDPLDNMPMSSLDVSGKRLFPVVNSALNLTQPAGDRLEWQQRKAASFTMTPLRCGSAPFGYVRTELYGRKPEKEDPARPSHPWAKKLDPNVDQTAGGVTLGRAMATSGAAASPNRGYNTSTLVAFTMYFFNLRLGWWLPNPQALFESLWNQDDPRAGFWHVLAEAMGQTSAQRSFVYLSDGGHFDNLGLYEMVRRRCRRIVVIDATQDPEFSYSDLESTVRKVRIDLGAEIVFERGLPTKKSVQDTGFHFALGRVNYAHSDRPGMIIYVKPALSGDEPFDVVRYARSQERPDAAFPHDPTHHQNFDEAQFESYRILGEHSITHTFKTAGTDTAPWSLTGHPNHPVKEDLPNAAEPEKPTPTVMAAPASFDWSGLRGITAGALIGTAAATGTVALTNNVVELKNPNLRLESNEVVLRDGAKVALEPSQPLELAPLKVDPSLTKAIDGLASRIGTDGGAIDHKTLVASLDRLAEALDGSTPREQIRIEIEVLRSEVRRLQVIVNGGGTTVTGEALTLRLEAIAKALTSMAGAINLLATSHDTQAAGVVKALESIAQAVRSTAPRSNISGTN